MHLILPNRPLAVTKFDETCMYISRLTRKICNNKIYERILQDALIYPRNPSGITFHDLYDSANADHIASISSTWVKQTIISILYSNSKMIQYVFLFCNYYAKYLRFYSLLIIIITVIIIIIIIIIIIMHYLIYLKSMLIKSWV